MAHGPGHYDDLCTFVREQADATGAIVIVLGGERGEGVSVQAPIFMQAAIPDMLRQMADIIEHDVAAWKRGE